MSLVRFDLGSELDELRREVNQVFATMPSLPTMFGAANGTSKFLPAMDTVERDGQLVITIDLPGMERDDIDVEVQDDLLTIRGARTIDRESEGDTWHRHERSTGSFERCLQLPQHINSKSVDASFDKGVLTVCLPLPGESRQTKPMKVNVKSAAGN